MTQFEIELLNKLLTQYSNEYKQTQPPVQQTQPPVQQTQPPVQQTQPPVQQTQPPVQQTQQYNTDDIINTLRAQGYSITAPQNQFDVLRSQLETLQRTIQLNNIQTTAQIPNQQTADDIIANIINPPLPAFGMEPNGGKVNG